MHQKKYSLDLKPPSKYTYSQNKQNTTSSKSKSYMVNDHNKIGATRISQSSLFLQSAMYNSPKTRRDQVYSTRKTGDYSRKLSLYERRQQQQQQQFYLPTITKQSRHNIYSNTNNNNTNNNPQQKSLSNLAMSSIITTKQHHHRQLSSSQQSHYYQSLIYQSLLLKPQYSSNYLSTLAGNHFVQSIQALKIGKQIKISTPERQLKLVKKNPKLKTVYLDLDQTLIHCDQTATSYTVKLNFPIQGSQETISAGIRVRPYCKQFLEELSKIAQVIIFTASSQSYADVILQYLDPEHKYFSHRLYRHHCKLQKGYYTKDLRLVSNRRLEDCLLVDNSAHCFMMQPYNGVPVIPFYHYLKDKELLSLLKWLKQALKQDDVRNSVKKSFFWHKYFQNDNDPKKIFITHYENAFL